RSGKASPWEPHPLVPIVRCHGHYFVGSRWVWLCGRPVHSTRRRKVGEFVRLEISGGIGTIRLDRPPMNALNAKVQEEMREAALAAAENPEVRAVIVYGGEKVFAAGADIKEMAEMSYVDMANRADALSAAFDSIARIPKPVVAAINGYALGGGCEIALACDWRIASADAKLGQPEITIGVIPGAGGTQRLARLVGPARAKDLIMSGRFVGADEALRSD